MTARSRWAWSRGPLRGDLARAWLRAGWFDVELAAGDRLSVAGIDVGRHLAADYKSTHVAVTVYRHGIVPAICGGATVMHDVFGVD